MRLWYLVCGLIMVMMLSLAGCGGSSSGTTARVRLLLGDAPIMMPDGTAVDSVNVPIARILLLTEADNDATAVVLYDGGSTPASLDLLCLANQSITQLQQNAIATSMGTVSIPAGHYSQMRLILSSGANCMVNGSPVDVKVPSGMETGLKVNIDLDLGAATLQDVLLDFNLSKLDYQPNSSRFILPPNALRLEKITQTANLMGNVTVTPPAGGLTDPVTVSLTVCDATGTPILVNGVPGATINTQVVIPVGETTAHYAINAIPTGGSGYQLQATVTYGAQSPVQTPIAFTAASGQTTQQDIAITGLQ